MQIKTILNRVQKFKSFVYGAVHLVEGTSVPTLEVELQPRLNSRPICSGCGYKRSGYDRSRERLFEFIPMWGHKVFFRYAPRRVDCPDCGVRVERAAHEYQNWKPDISKDFTKEADILGNPVRYWFLHLTL
ncbi:MAG: hypothetical protein GY875_11685 [Gammaproteobacteria bacterium]|nr:hypothetical protein [Gammaproteobacteria bacterium]